MHHIGAYFSIAEFGEIAIQRNYPEMIRYLDRRNKKINYFCNGNFVYAKKETEQKIYIIH